MPELTLPYAQERWFVLLQEAVSQSSLSAVAKGLGYTNHTGVSLVLRGKYPASLDSFAARVLAKLDRVTCPHLHTELAINDCRAVALAPMPTNNPMKRQHWQSCQRCPHKPQDPQSAKEK